MQACKKLLIIDSVIMKQAEQSQRNLTMCYTNYKNAFYFIPHSWLLRILEIHKIHPEIQNFLPTIMQTWRTYIHLSPNLRTKDIAIRKGIFQGDSLSAL